MYNLQLVVAREHRHPGRSFGVLVANMHALSKILDEVDNSRPCQDLSPEVVRGDPEKIGWIGGRVARSLIERSEIRLITPQLGANEYLLLVYGEMCHAASGLKKWLL